MGQRHSPWPRTAPVTLGALRKSGALPIEEINKKVTHSSCPKDYFMTHIDTKKQRIINLTMSVCLPQWTGDSMRAGILSLGFAHLSLAPSAINTYCLTNCPKSHTHGRKPLRDIVLPRVSSLQIAEFPCGVAMGCERRPGIDGGRDSLPPKRPETQPRRRHWL